MWWFPKLSILFSNKHKLNLSNNMFTDAVCIKQLEDGGNAKLRLYERKTEHGECVQFVAKFLQIQAHASVAGGRGKREMENYLEECLIKEYKIGRNLCHPGIIRTLGFDLPQKCLYVEYCQGMDMLEYLNELKGADTKHCLAYVSQLLDAVEYLHNKGIAHLDIKLENIMLDVQAQNIKLIDFGQSKVFRKGDKNKLFRGLCGTWAYMPPEVVRGLYDCEKVDVWCCGLVLFSCVYDFSPWDEAVESRDRRFAMFRAYRLLDKLYPGTFIDLNEKGYSPADKAILEATFLATLAIDYTARHQIHEVKQLFNTVSFIKGES